MKKDNQKIIELLSDPGFRQWVLDSSESQEVYWQEWIKSHSHHREDLLKAREIILRLRFKNENLGETEKDDILYQVIAHSKEEKQNRTNHIAFYWKRIAAAIVLIISATFLFYFLNSSDLFQQSSNQNLDPINYITKHNISGVKSQIMLPDGTKVFLNSESSIVYPDPFPNDQRQIKLVGEAFFEVARDSLRPFSVLAKNTITTALGTSFNVQAYKSESNVNVSLVSGKVVVRSSESDAKDFNLNPGEKVVFSKDESYLTNYNYLTDLGWKDGYLTFKNANFSEFIDKIERWYGVDIEVITTPKDQWNIDGSFENETLNEILTSVSYTHDVKYEINGKKVKVNFD